MAAQPTLANRGFLARAVRFLAAEVGIRQFLDIGTGIPTVNNTHEVAQRVVPASRIRGPRPDRPRPRQVLAEQHARWCLRLPGGRPAGAEAILSAAAGTLDFSQPVAVMLIAVMHFTGDDAQARSILDRLTGACGPGSFLALSHAAAASGMFVTACMSSGTPAATQAPSSVPASPTGSVGAAAAPRL
jgi:hypothetical protein